MSITRQVAVNLSEHYRKKGYGEITKSSLETIKRLPGKDFLIQTAPLDFNPQASGDKMQRYISAVCNLNTAIATCRIARVDDSDNTNVMLELDVRFIDSRIAGINVDDLVFSPVGVAGHISVTEKQFSLMGFVCYLKENII